MKENMRQPLSNEDFDRLRKTIGWKLGGNSGQKPQQWTPVNNSKGLQPVYQPNVCINDILNGTTFESGEKKGKMSIGIAVALQKALDFAGPKGYVATMPELIAAKLKAEKSHALWENLYDVHTEENIGIDTKGRFYSANEPVLVIVNGGGILTPERIITAHENGLVEGGAKYDPKEFDDLLDEKLPSGEYLDLFKFEEIRDGVSNLPHRFGVVMPYSVAQSTRSGYHQKKEFMDNPLVIARFGGVENMESYYEMAKRSGGDLVCHHSLHGRDANTPQGRVSFLNNNYYGLGVYLYESNESRFVVVQGDPSSTKK